MNSTADYTANALHASRQREYAAELANEFDHGCECPCVACAEMVRCIGCNEPLADGEDPKELCGVCRDGDEQEQPPALRTCTDCGVETLHWPGDPVCPDCLFAHELRQTQLDLIAFMVSQGIERKPMAGVPF